MMRIVLIWVLLVVIYCLVLGSFAPWNLVAGAFFAGLFIWFSWRFVFGNPVEPLHVGWRIIRVIPFLGMILWKILEGTWNVALVSIGIQSLSNPGIVAIPIEGQSRSGTLLFCQVMSLSPSSVLVQIDWEREEALFHMISASNPEKTRQEFLNFYRRYQQPIYP